MICGDMKKVDDTGIMYPVYIDGPANNLEWIPYGCDSVDSFDTVMWVADGIRVASCWRRWVASWAVGQVDGGVDWGRI